MLSLARAVSGAALDYLSPARCVGCGVGGRWLCRPCAFELGETPGLSCPGCVRTAAHGETCDLCRLLGSPLDQLVAGFSYERPVLHKLLWSFKERGSRAALPALAARLSAVAREHVQVTAPAVVAHVPASPKRIRERGFDQAGLLATRVATTLGVPHVQLLRRVRSGAAQKTLDVLDRRAALQGCFAVAADGVGPGSGPPATVVLVDDVATTLATLETCAALLRDAGVRSVVGLVLAHAEASADEKPKSVDAGGEAGYARPARPAVRYSSG